MPVREDRNNRQGITRRSVLGLFSLGIASLLGTGFFLRHLLSSGKEADSPSDQGFPGEDSIFHPREDPRLDPRRRS